MLKRHKTQQVVGRTNKRKPLPRDARPASASPDAETDASDPNRYFAEKYPAVAERYGPALRIKRGAGGYCVADLSQSFFAGVLGVQGTPQAPRVFVEDEHRFYRFEPGVGINVEAPKYRLREILRDVLHGCVRDCRTEVDTSPLQFGLGSASKLTGVVEQAKAVLAVKSDFFDHDSTKFLACNNGLLDLETKELQPFGPAHHIRNKLAVKYDRHATCPMFCDTLLGPALSADDFSLFQLCCGLLLVGKNLAHAIIVFEGPGGAGKGTVVRVLCGVIGPENIGMLRPNLLDARFEIGRHVGKTLLYGPDVPSDFLQPRGAAVLKSLTGGDLMTAEFKG